MGAAPAYGPSDRECGSLRPDGSLYCLVQLACSIPAQTRMTFDKIAYRKGYKYQLAGTCCYALLVDIKVVISTEFIDLGSSGDLIIKSGYAWDGPSGPAMDTKTAMRGSLIHDALYQLMRMNLLPQSFRLIADKKYRAVCGLDGMSAFRRWYHFRLIRRLASGAAKPRARKKVFIAPVLAAFVLMGCASSYAAIGAAAADKSVKGALFVICRAGSIGSITRAFLSDPETAKAWGILCNRKTYLPFDSHEPDNQ